MKLLFVSVYFKCKMFVQWNIELLIVLTSFSSDDLPIDLSVAEVNTNDDIDSVVDEPLFWARTNNRLESSENNKIVLVICDGRLVYSGPEVLFRFGKLFVLGNIDG